MRLAPLMVCLVAGGILAPCLGWAGGCVDPTTGQVINDIDPSTDPRCRQRSGSSGSSSGGSSGAGARYGGGHSAAQRQAEWQETLRQEQSGADAENRRIAAEHAEFLRRQAERQAAEPQEPTAASSQHPADLEKDKQDTLRQMRGLGGKTETKEANDDGLHLRGFDKSQQPSRKELRAQKAIPRLCADCLGAYTAAANACDANTNHLAMNKCLNRAFGSWNRCVAIVDCPAKLRPRISKKTPRTLKERR
jgi:hypothetical protein